MQTLRILLSAILSLCLIECQVFALPAAHKSKLIASKSDGNNHGKDVEKIPVVVPQSQPQQKPIQTVTTAQLSNIQSAPTKPVEAMPSLSIIPILPDPAQQLAAQAKPVESAPAVATQVNPTSLTPAALPEMKPIPDLTTQKAEPSTASTSTKSRSTNPFENGSIPADQVPASVASMDGSEPTQASVSSTEDQAFDETLSSSMISLFARLFPDILGPMPIGPTILGPRIMFFDPMESFFNDIGPPQPLDMLDSSNTIKPIEEVNIPPPEYQTQLLPPPSTEIITATNDNKPVESATTIESQSDQAIGDGSVQPVPLSQDASSAEPSSSEGSSSTSASSDTSTSTESTATSTESDDASKAVSSDGSNTETPTTSDNTPATESSDASASTSTDTPASTSSDAPVTATDDAPVTATDDAPAAKADDSSTTTSKDTPASTSNDASATTSDDKPAQTLDATPAANPSDASASTSKDATAVASDEDSSINPALNGRDE